MKDNFDNDYEYNWDDRYYGTGPTEPPKERGGLVALMLILIIFLFGIITVLGILNIRLFQELKLKRQETELSISFTTEATLPPETVPLQIPEEAAAMAEDPAVSSIQIQQSPQSRDNVPMEGGLSLQEIYVENIGSVVSISCEGYSSSSTGTGVILSRNGYIVTNAHVVDNAGSISVLLTDDRVLSASVVGSDEISDLAVLRVEASDLIPAEFGDSSQLRIGDTVVAIGDPLGVKYRGTYTDGIVSAINRDVDMDGRTMTLIQTNAALNSGNSGGPLINRYGQVIGINTMKISAFVDSAGVEGLGFAIPSATVKDIVNQLLTNGYVSGRPTLGITGESLTMFYRYYYHLPDGLYVNKVERGSPADRLGITAGDIILSLDGVSITSTEELNSVLFSHEVGDRVEIVIYRGGQKLSATVTLAEDRG